MLVAQREAIAIMQANPAIRVRPGTDAGSYEDMRERAVTVLYGEHPTPDRRAALYISLAVAVTVPALADLPTDAQRETLTRTCTRLSKPDGPPAPGPLTEEAGSVAGCRSGGGVVGQTSLFHMRNSVHLPFLSNVTVQRLAKVPSSL